MNILITGASGFIGSNLFDYFSSNKKVNVIGLSRSESTSLELSPPIDDEELWDNCLENQDVLIHCAGRAHILNEKINNPLTEFRKINVEFSIKLAHYSIKAKIKRFIFFSSLGVHGTETTNQAFSEKMKVNPTLDYAISKLEAEEYLKGIFKNSATELVIIRPPLVYSHEAPGNFERLLKLSSFGFPLPFLGIKNRRSLISILNLTNFVELCCVHPNAGGETFLIADDEVLSTADILNCLYSGMSNKMRVFSLPNALVKAAFVITGKKNIYYKMFSSLEVSNQKAKRLLGWCPVEDSYTAIKKAGQEFKSVECIK